ncbi:MAG: DNA primase [Bacteroidales bacterium]
MIPNPMISNSEEIKKAAQISDIIGDFVTIRRKGVNYTACCPFHTEKTPSFIVNPVKGNYKCFGCGKSGDSIEFLREHEAMTYAEALTYIARKYNIAIEQGGDDQQFTEAEKKREAIFIVLNWAKAHFKANLTERSARGENQALEYLKKRGLDQATGLFEIGYAGSGNDLLHAAHQVGYSDESLLNAGLIRKNEQGQFYDAFARRIMFPFIDRSGRVIGFTGRLLAVEKDKPKYLHSPETEVFRKSRFLFGLYQSKREIMKENECLLVEGQTDMISLHLAGIKHVVSGSGTALSEEQGRMILSLTSCLTIVYDGDPAGIKASITNIKIPLQLGLDVYIVVLPQGDDPDSFIKKNGGPAMAHYIEDHRKDILTFRIEMVKEEVEKDPLQKMRLIKELVVQLSVITDEMTRVFLLRELAKKLDVNYDDIAIQVKKLLPIPVAKTESSFFGLDAAQEGIQEKEHAILLGDPKEVVSRHADGGNNVISLPDGPLRHDAVAGLVRLTKSIRIEGLSVIMDVESDSELPLAAAGRMLTEQGMRVEVIEKFVTDRTGEVEERFTTHDFLDFYVSSLTNSLFSHPDTKRSKKYVEMVAAFLARLDNTIIHIKTVEIAKKFGLTSGSFSKVLRPFVEKRKNLAVQQQEHLVIDDRQYVFDIAHLPDYVDVAFFSKYGFFPAQNKSGSKIFYVFRTMENTLIKVGNFYMEPLFQVYDPDPLKNKRIVKLFNCEQNTEEYIEFKSGDMIELAPFKKFLWNMGSFIFTNGRPIHHEKILESISNQFPKCHELSIFGMQPEGFFAFSNGIIADNAFTSVDELGLVKFKKETYYLPAFSKIYKDQRSDNDKYEYDRFLVYNPDQRTSWVEWSDLICKVYANNNNGMWALLFAILSVNRSIIFPIERFFTSIFFIGPTESGKSKIAESIRAPFMFGAPLFNLNSGTDAAFFTSLERFRDIPVIFEEYEDYQISDVKFQGLKAAVYDNEGKQKRKDATSKDIDVSKIYASPVLLGQNGPERDDGALGNRVVQKHVPKKDNWTDEEVTRFKDLKDREREGLSNIAMEIIRRRPVVQKYFAAYMRDFQKKVKEDIRKEGGSYQTRMINTVSLFIAMARLWQDHVAELPLPFNFEEFYQDAKQQITRQSEELSSSNRLSVFFDTISMLYAQGQIITGREFDISTEDRITVQKSKTDTDEKSWDGMKKKILWLIVNDVIQVYQKLHTSESLKLNALRMYLKDHPAYLGQVQSHRFNYQYEAWEADPSNSEFTRRVIKKAVRNTSCIALDYGLIEKMGIDLERLKAPEQIELDFKEPNDSSAETTDQTFINFPDVSLEHAESEVLPF